AATVAITYTNEQGVTGRSTGASVSLASFTTRRLVPMPLQAGDRGVQAITGHTVGGTAAATGTYNIVVARPLVNNMRVRLAGDGDLTGWDGTGLQRVYADSALWPVITTDSTSSGVPTVSTSIING
ncbi:MAG: hypothetical protein ACRCSN_19665, partial [Dermatophilaceae bacterium]